MQFDPKLLKAAIYGANDGIITTFAVVAGVAGAQLPARVIIILGIANMIADGLSMGLSDYLGEHSEQRARVQQNKSVDLEEKVWKTGLITFIAFVIAGSLPLLPYVSSLIGIVVPATIQFPLSVVATGGALFTVGSLRTRFTGGSWFKNGLEMLAIGAIAAVVAYGLGAVVERYADL